MTWLLAVALPLLATCLLLPASTAPVAARWLLPLSALPALALALAADANAIVPVDWLLLGSAFGLGSAGRVLLAFTAFLWSIAGFYAGAYLEHDPRARRFFVFFGLSMCGNLGLIVAQDMVSFYFFFALMTFSAYGLVVHNGDAQAYRAGRIYLVTAIFGEVLLLAALLLCALEMQSLLLSEARAVVARSVRRDLIVLLAFSGFGVKAGIALLHFWLPLAHPVAPIPASAVLSGAMIKAGLLGWLHFMPFGEGAFASWSAALVIMGHIAAFCAAAIGLAQRDPKTVLAYSSVSQMGVITSVLGIGLADPARWPLVLPAVLVLAFNHALAKGALFLGVGIVAHARRGLQQIIAVAGSSVAALAIAGAPWTGGAVAKDAAKSALVALETPGYAALPALMALSSVATTMLLTRFVALSLRTPSHGPLPRRMLGSWLTIVVAAALGVPALLAWFAVAIDTGERDTWSALWPVAAGVGLYALAAHLAPRAAPSIPPGDMVVLLERALRKLLDALRRMRIPGPAAWQIDLVHYVEHVGAGEARRDLLRRMDLRLTRWTNAGIAFTAVIFAVLALALI